MRDREKERGREKGSNTQTQTTCSWSVYASARESCRLSFRVQGVFVCTDAYLWLLFTNVCKVVCSTPLLLSSLHTHRLWTIEREWVTFWVQRPAKNIKIERKRDTTTKTLTTDWVTSGHIHQSTEKYCGVSVTAHLLDRDICVPPTVGTYGWGGVGLSNPHPHPAPVWLQGVNVRDRDKQALKFKKFLFLWLLSWNSNPLCVISITHTHVMLLNGQSVQSLLNKIIQKRKLSSITHPYVFPNLERLKTKREKLHEYPAG